MAGKIAVMGAGAVGSYYGALLAEAGSAVTLIGRPAMVAAIAAKGLTLETGGGRRQVTIDAASDPAAVAGADLVLFCVKSGDTEAAGQQIAPYLAPDAVVLSLQNGVGNAERLSAVLGRPVIQVVVYVAVDAPAPGHVRHHGRGELILAPGPGAEAVAASLRGAGIQAQVSADAEVTAWTKFTANCCLNAISALGRQDYGHIAAQDGIETLLHQLLTECLAVAQASGIALPASIWDDILGITRSMAGQYSSTAQDLFRGRRTEIDYLNGEVVRRGAALGIPTPVNQALWVLVRLAETAPPAPSREGKL